MDFQKILNLRTRCVRRSCQADGRPVASGQALVWEAFFPGWDWSLIHHRSACRSGFTLMRDDGVIVYLNSAQIFISNMPGGTITYLTNADSVDLALDLRLTADRALPGGASLDDLYLTNDLQIPPQWNFPGGIVMPEGANQLVWADAEPGETISTNLHANFLLNASSGLVALVRGNGGNPLVLDVLEYNSIAPNRPFRVCLER